MEERKKLDLSKKKTISKFRFNKKKCKCNKRNNQALCKNFNNLKQNIMTFKHLSYPLNKRKKSQSIDRYKRLIIKL
jgi:hypothetical protein